MVDVKRRMLITGISGLMGNNLAYYFKNKYDILGIYHQHPIGIGAVATINADILDKLLMRKIIDDFQPAVVIHCASLTNVDFCETNRELTDLVNIEGTKIIVESLKDADTKLIYISSDSVYDGVKGDFQESDSVNPQNYYGLSKYKGELAVIKNKYALILRTNIFGWNILPKFSIAEWILNELINKRPIKGFCDAFFSSIYNFELARVMDMTIERNLSGVFNCGSSTSMSKYEFALHIADCFNLEKDLIQPISIDDFAFRAKRGKTLTMNVGKLEKALSCKLPAIDDCIKFFYEDFRAGIPQKIRLPISE